MGAGVLGYSFHVDSPRDIEAPGVVFRYRLSDSVLINSCESRACSLVTRVAGILFFGGGGGGGESRESGTGLDFALTGDGDFGGERRRGFGIGFRNELLSMSVILGCFLDGAVTFLYEGGAALLRRHDGTSSVKQDIYLNNSTISPAHVLILSQRRDFLKVVSGIS